MKLFRNSALIALICAFIFLLGGCASGNTGSVAMSAGIAPATPTPKDITVSTVDELLAALESGRTVRLTSGRYDISEAVNYGIRHSLSYNWEKVSDGWELVLSDVSGLTVIAEEGAEICTSSRHASVLRFDECRDISLQGLTLGHTDGEGVCTGNVISLVGCRDISLQECELYGCGAVAVSAGTSRNISISSSRLYSCSVGALRLSASKGILLENCTVESCGREGNIAASLFDMSSSSWVVMKDCTVRRNYAACVFLQSYADNVYVISSAFENNSAPDGFVVAAGAAPEFISCTSDGEAMLPAVDGPAPLADEAQDTDGYVQTILAGLAEARSEASGKVYGEVTVSNVDELLAAIGSDRRIYLEPGTYALSSASSCGGYGSDSYYWINTYDGPELIITGVSNMEIIGSGTDSVLITAQPRYANVIGFEKCSNISISGVTAGHTEQPGECSGGVLYFFKCGKVAVESCSLYGCGILGISAHSCTDMAVSDCEIYDCSMGAVELLGCEHVTFTGCNIHDCASPDFYLSGCSRVSYDGEGLHDGLYNDASMMGRK